MKNPCTSVFPNTRAWEDQKNETYTEDGKNRGVSMERRKADKKKRSPTAYHYLIKI